MAEFRKSVFVDADLIAIWCYIAQDNSEVANRVVQSAHLTFEKLANHLGMERVREFTEGLRPFQVEGFRNYLIFYRETEWGIEIVRVLHGSRHFMTLFKE